MATSALPRAIRERASFVMAYIGILYSWIKVNSTVAELSSQQLWAECRAKHMRTALLDFACLQSYHFRAVESLRLGVDLTGEALRIYYLSA